MSYNPSNLVNLGQMQSAMEEAQSFTSQVALAAAEAIEEALPSTSAITIPMSGWALDNTEHMYKCTVSITGVTANHIPIVTLDKASQDVSGEAGMDSSAGTVNGGVVFRAAAIPTQNLTGSIQLCLAKE